MTSTQHIALDLAAAGRLSTPRLARAAGVTVMDAARAIVDLTSAKKITNYGGTYVLRPAR